MQYNVFGINLIFKESRTHKDYIYLDIVSSNLPKGFGVIYNTGAFKRDNLNSKIEIIKCDLRNCFIGAKVEEYINQLNLPDHIRVNYSYTNSIYITNTKTRDSIRISDHSTGAEHFVHKFHLNNWTVGNITGAIDICLALIDI